MKNEFYETAKRHVIESLDEANAEVNNLHWIATTDKTLPLPVLNITLTITRLIQAVRKMLHARSDVLLHVINQQTDTLATQNIVITKQTQELDNLQRQINALANRIKYHVDTHQ